MGEYSGKVVLITGAGQGVGRELALAFGAHGSVVAANALTPVGLDETAAQVRALGGQIETCVADIANKLALQSMIHQIMDNYGRLDILIQAASVDPADSLLQMDEWDWRRTLDSNLTGPFLLMQSVARVMRARGGGVMVNLVRGDEQSRAAIAAKAGLLALTRAAASEFESDQIRINAVSSGLPDAVQLLGVPEDPVDLILHLCSQEGSDINGEIIGYCPRG